MYVYLHTRTNIYIYIYTYIHILAYTYTCMHKHTKSCIRARIGISKTLGGRRIGKSVYRRLCGGQRIRVSRPYGGTGAAAYRRIGDLGRGCDWRISVTSDVSGRGRPAYRGVLAWRGASGVSAYRRLWKGEAAYRHIGDHGGEPVYRRIGGLGGRRPPAHRRIERLWGTGISAHSRLVLACRRIGARHSLHARC